MSFKKHLPAATPGQCVCCNLNFLLHKQAGRTISINSCHISISLSADLKQCNLCSSFEQVERATDKHRLEGDPAAIQAARTMHVTVHQLRHLEPFVIPPAFLAAAFHELARQQALVGDLATAV